MSGRAGRRGQDDRGLVITVADDEYTREICREMMTGQPLALESSFRLTYYTILNVMRRAEERERTTDFVISKGK